MHRRNHALLQADIMLYIEGQNISAEVETAPLNAYGPDATRHREGLYSRTRIPGASMRRYTETPVIRFPDPSRIQPDNVP